MAFWNKVVSPNLFGSPIFNQPANLDRLVDRAVIRLIRAKMLLLESHHNRETR